MSTLQDSKPFAFTAGRYGNRPVYLVTRRWTGDQPSLTLYELAPTEVAQTHHERFSEVSTAASLTLHDLSAVIIDGETPNDIQATDGNHDWTGWKALKITELRDRRARIVINHLLRPALTAGGYDASRVCTGAEDSLGIAESVGIRLSIAFRALKPVRRADRLKAIADGVADMSLGECYFWHAKLRSPTTPNGAPALRTLLANHID